MASKKSNACLLSAVFSIFCKPNSDPLTIDNIDVLSLEDQLDTLKMDKISDIPKRKALTISLYDRVPDLKNTAHRRIRFKSCLSSYHKTCLELDSLVPQQWTPRHVPLALFNFILQRLHATFDDTSNEDKAAKAIKKAVKNLPSTCKFIDFMRQFCDAERYNGAELLKFKGGGGKALKFAKDICAKFGLKFGKFASVKNHMSSWFTELDKLVASGPKMRPVTTTVTRYTPQVPATVATKPAQTTYTAPAPAVTVLDDNEKWWWVDMEELEVVPFGDDSQKILDQSYANNVKSVDIADGKYRVQFDFGDASGHMITKEDDGTWDDEQIMILRTEPDDDEIHGMGIADKPQF